MDKPKVVYLVSGSRHTVPPSKNSPGVPRVIAALSAIDSYKFQFKVISKYDVSLEAQSFDQIKYLHVKPTFLNRFFEKFLNF